MKVFVCDKCGDVVKQVVHISTKPRSVNNYYKTWSSHNIDGDYCEKCMEKIGEAITGWKTISKS